MPLASYANTDKRADARSGIMEMVSILRSCLVKVHTHFASVIWIMAIRTIFSADRANISKSLDSRR